MGKVRVYNGRCIGAWKLAEDHHHPRPGDRMEKSEGLSTWHHTYRVPHKAEEWQKKENGTWE